jgi:hypothetical protein
VGGGAVVFDFVAEAPVVAGLLAVAVEVAGFLAVAVEEAACACTARRETPAIAARAMEPLRLENLRDMTCFLRSE